MSWVNKLTKQLVAAVTGALALGLAAGAATAGYRADRQAPEFIAAPRAEVPHTDGAIVCTGGVIRAVQGGINVSDVDEAITGWAGAYSSHSAAAKPLGGGSDTDGAPTSAEFTGVLPADALHTSDLGVPALTGAIHTGGTVVTGANTHSAAAGDLRGVSVNPCQWPANTVWLVGGASDVGSSLRVTIANPGKTPITVDMTALSSRGILDLGANSQVVLAPESTQSVVLDGLIPADPRIALRLASAGGAFSATMQTATLEGVTPAGIDTITQSEAGTKLVIPGLVINAAAGQEDSTLPDPAYSATLRVVNPNDEPATVSVGVRGTGGTEPLTGGTDVVVAAQSVLDLSLDGIAPGAYAIDVTANRGVTAAVNVTRTDEAGKDVAWLAATEPVSGTGAAAFGPLPASLVLVGQQATWIAYDDAGNELTREQVTIDGTTVVQMPEQAAFVSVDADDVYASLWITTEHGIASVPLIQDMSASSSVRLTVGN
ncbi:DUF5719 family protein [Trueperella bialowiezensis]|uniref:Secreted protein n=1 Tax=Trueperella bialowiezensis TaxID=312285 RepID=A0A3S4YXD2_9ACTO|nr:DUF5719 family protein [Trueperella bialowiezensis]VEI12901.1 Uncharacterised protein [Trueperella bialowiezensis]